MAFYDTTTGEYNNQAIAYDTTQTLADQPSFFTSLGNVAVKAVPLTILSIGNSFINTGIELSNVFGAEIAPLRAEKELESWGATSYADYYKKHESGIEAAGLVFGSLLPGMAGIKALKAAQAGALGAGGIVQRATSLFSGPSTRIVENAVREIEAGEGGLFGNYTAQKTKAIALGFGDQALQALTYEIATAATMKASPLLDNDSLLDTASHVLSGMALGGLVGGVFHGIGLRSTINKALLAKDIETKPMETIIRPGYKEGSTFQGVPTAGDEVAFVLESVDKIPQSLGGNVGLRKADSTTTNALLDAKKILRGIVQGEDGELSNFVVDILHTARTTAAASTDDLYNYFGRLASIKRVGEQPSIPSTDFFYVNRFVKGNTFTFDQATTNVPLESADLSLRYQMKRYTTKVDVANFTETIPGTTTPLYADSREAFSKGMDIFINKNMLVQVNPNAPNIAGRVPRPGESRVLSMSEERLFRKTGQAPEGSAPIMGAPLILRSDGTFLTSVIPVVGDYGEVAVTRSGLNYGSRSSIQSVDTGLPFDVKAIDANARYVWWNERGLKRGDTIDFGGLTSKNELLAADIPAMEELYRQSLTASKGSGDFSSYFDMLENKMKVTFEGVTKDEVSTPASLLKKIEEAKDTFIAQELKSDFSNAEAIAMKTNTPLSYLESGLRAEKATDFMLDTTKHAQLNHVQLEYHIGNVLNDTEGNIARGMLDVQLRQQLIKTVQRDTATSFFKEKAQQFFIDSYKSTDATSQGTGPGAFSFSNAPYFTMGQATERVGRASTRAIIDRNSGDTRQLIVQTNALRDDKIASGDWGMFIAVRHRTGENYTFLPPTIAEANGLNPQTTVVLTRSLIKDKVGNIIDWNKNLTPEGFLPTAAKQDRAGFIAEQADALHTFYELNPKVANFERAQQQINDIRLIQQNNLYAAHGLSRKTELGNLYAPPIDTKKYPHIAFVKANKGMAFSDDSVAVITAETEEKLSQKIAALKGDFSIFTKDLLKKYHEVQGDYEYDRNFASSYVKSELTRRGILNDIFPDTHPDTIIPKYADFNAKQNTRLIRDYVELANAQLFAELDQMGQRYVGLQTSKAGPVAQFLGAGQVSNPYKSFKDQALAISDKENYKMWSEGQEKIEAFADSAWREARNNTDKLLKGVITLDEATAASARVGIQNPYGRGVDALHAYTEIANQLPPSRSLTRFVNTANQIQAAFAVRLDMFQSLINIVSTPVLLLAETNAAIKAATSITLPDGSGRQIPGITKVIGQSIQNLFSKSYRDQWLPYFEDTGNIRKNLNDYMNLVDLSSLPAGRVSEGQLQTRTQQLLEKASLYSGAYHSETFSRFVVADVAKQIFEAAGFTGQDLMDHIGTFVNRVNGNYIASQRPIAFQGPIGQALSLFQTYQVNLFQQLFRYVEEGQGKSIALMAAAQTTLFGFQGLPGFQMINNHLIGNARGNVGHADAYSTVPSFTGFDNSLGNYLLYGVTSNILNTGLYGRGDINPRQLSILPLNPMDFPAISGGITFLSNLLSTADKLIAGGSVSNILLTGMEHNGLSRPLSGFAQIAQGYVTTSSGGLLAAISQNLVDKTPGWSDVVNWANFGRLAGARPLDQAIAMDATYRATLYKAKDLTRIQVLGSAVKSYLYGGGEIGSDAMDRFVVDYAQAGGSPMHFAGQMIRWTQEANVARANDIYRHLQRPLNQEMMKIMSGEQLPDFRNQVGISGSARPAFP